MPIPLSFEALLHAEVQISDPVRNDGLGQNMAGVIDTGSSLTLISLNGAQKLLGLDVWKRVVALSGKGLQGGNRALRTADGRTVMSVRIPNLQVKFGGVHKNMDIYCTDSLPVPLLLGCDFLTKFDLAVHVGSRTLYSKSVVRNDPSPNLGDTVDSQSFPVLALGGGVIPAQSEKLVRARVTCLPSGCVRGLDAFFTFCASSNLPRSILGAASLVKLQGNTIPV